MNSANNKNGFEIALHRAFSTLRDQFSAPEAFQYISALVFLQWLDDIEKKPVRFQRLRVVTDISFRHLMQHIDEADLGPRVHAAFDKLEEMNEGELGNVFRALDFSSSRFGAGTDSWKLLRDLLVALDGSELHRSDDCGFTTHTLDEFFTVASRTILSSMQAPEFNTPREIAQIIANIVEVSATDSIYDPACGSGQLLLACAEYANSKANRLCGSEKNLAAWSIAKINLLSHGFSSAEIQNCDSLDPQTFSRSFEGELLFDVVVAHPPWGMRWNDAFATSDPYGQYRYGMPPKNSADFAFIQHMLAVLCPKNGRMIAVMSTGVLTRAGQERAIRENLISANLIDAVIALPEKLFQNTSVAGALLVFKTNRTRKDIFFYDARPLAKSVRGKNILTDKAVKQIIDSYRARRAVPGHSALVSTSKVRERNFSLNASAFIDMSKSIEMPPLSDVRAKREALEMQLEGVDLELKRVLSAI